MKCKITDLCFWNNNKKLKYNINFKIRQKIESASNKQKKSINLYDFFVKLQSRLLILLFVLNNNATNPEYLSVQFRKIMFILCPIIEINRFNVWVGKIAFQ
jgi:hypothetical protein